MRRAVHPSLSKSRRLLGERQESADKHDAQARYKHDAQARYKHDAQASELSDTLACASCLYGDNHSFAARVTPSESTTTRSFDFTQN